MWAGDDCLTMAQWFISSQLDRQGFKSRWKKAYLSTVGTPARGNPSRWGSSGSLRNFCGSCSEQPLNDQSACKAGGGDVCASCLNSNGDTRNIAPGVSGPEHGLPGYLDLKQVYGEDRNSYKCKLEQDQLEVTWPRIHVIALYVIKWWCIVASSAWSVVKICVPMYLWLWMVNGCIYVNICLS